MGVISLLLIIIVLGVVAYLVSKYLPMTPLFKDLFYIVLVFIVIVVILEFLGLMPSTGAHHL